VLALIGVLAGIYLPAEAKEVEKTVVMFRSMDDPDIEPDLEVLLRAEECDPLLVLENPYLVPLGASLWSSQTRSKDGMMVKEKIRQIGTATAVTALTDLTFNPFDKEAPFYFEGDIDGLYITACGECEVTNNAMMEGGPIFVTCYLDVDPELSTEGIKWGQAVSNSTFVLAPIPGFETGSFWTIQLIWE
jgi:hypothetical protein